LNENGPERLLGAVLCLNARFACDMADVE